MTQRQVSHVAGEIPPCDKYPSHVPKHYEDKRCAHAGGGHFIECHACGVRTERQPDFSSALQDWCRRMGVPVPGASRLSPSTVIRAIR